MPADILASLAARQANTGDAGFDSEDGFDGPDNFWYTKTGFIVRNAVFGGLFLLFVLFLTTSYVHLRRRQRKGLAPLRYHRWLAPRPRAPVYYHPNPPPGAATYGYWQPPPPVYNGADGPPVYAYGPGFAAPEAKGSLGAERGAAAGQSVEMASVRAPEPTHHQYTQ